MSEISIMHEVRIKQPAGSGTPLTLGELEVALLTARENGFAADSVILGEVTHDIRVTTGPMVGLTIRDGAK